MLEHGTQFGFRGKRVHIAKVYIPNLSYLNQYIEIEKPHGSRDHVVVPDTVKCMFYFDNQSADKTCSIVSNVVRVLVKEKVLVLESTEVNAIKNVDIFVLVKKSLKVYKL